MYVHVFLGRPILADPTIAIYKAQIIGSIYHLVICVLYEYL